VRELTPEEVLAQLEVSGGSPDERAAATAVLAAAIADSQNLGRQVINPGSSRWAAPQLRENLGAANDGLRRPLH
jgi:hypothetical protein